MWLEPESKVTSLAQNNLLKFKEKKSWLNYKGCWWQSLLEHFNKLILFIIANQVTLDKFDIIYYLMLNFVLSIGPIHKMEDIWIEWIRVEFTFSVLPYMLPRSRLYLLRWTQGRLQGQGWWEEPQNPPWQEIIRLLVRQEDWSDVLPESQKLLSQLLLP